MLNTNIPLSNGIRTVSDFKWLNGHLGFIIYSYTVQKARIFKYYQKSVIFGTISGKSNSSRPIVTLIIRLLVHLKEYTQLYDFAHHVSL